MSLWRYPVHTPFHVVCIVFFSSLQAPLCISGTLTETHKYQEEGCQTFEKILVTTKKNKLSEFLLANATVQVKDGLQHNHLFSQVPNLHQCVYDALYTCAHLIFRRYPSGVRSSMHYLSYCSSYKEDIFLLLQEKLFGLKT